MINAEAVSRRDAEIIENLLSEQVLDAAIEVHRTLGGPGLLESLYEDALFYELRLRNIPALSQVQIPVTYKNFKLGLVINFGQGRLIDGWERVVNNL